MSASSPNLDVIQRWMQSVIVHADGVEAGIESESAQDEIALTAGRIEEMICPSRSQTSIERLEVYANAYKARLLEVLIGEYPALVHALGEDAFVGMASAYLEEHPPSSYTLAELGRWFPDYLAQTRPPHENDAGVPDWADFLVDLARLERIYSEVFDGPGIEGQTTLQPAELQGMSPDEWLAARLTPAPCLRLESFRFPVHEYATAVRNQQVPEVPTSQPIQLAITRREFIVRRVTLTQAEFTVLSALLEGKSVGEALELAFSNETGSLDDLAANVRVWFRNWAAAGYFVSLMQS